MENLPPPDYNSPTDIRRFLDSRSLSPRKQYGQNFLINPGARAKIVDALELPADGAVWEPGPGLGAMTSLLLDRGARVVAFEIDPGFCAALRGFFGRNSRFSLVEGDILKTWPGSSAPGDYLLGNLPYNAGAAILASFIEKKKFFTRMAVTVQKETGERMCAGPGDADYSSFSVLVSAAYRVRRVLAMDRKLFYPEPNVESSALRLDLREDGIGEGHAQLFPLVRALFSSRRKTLKNNLENFAARRVQGADGKNAREIAGEVLSGAGIRPEERAENLGLEEFVRLEESWEKTLGGEGSRGDQGKHRGA